MKGRHAWLLPLALLAACVAQPPAREAAPVPPRATGAEELTVVLYRGLRVLPGTTNQVDWSDNSFRVTGQPPTLSLFDAIHPPPMPGIPCWLSITVTAQPPVGQGTVASLVIPNPPPGNANPGPWAVVFDNVPPGHWSIARATIGGATNNQASPRAAAVFHAMAGAGTAQVLDGTAVGCH